MVIIPNNLGYESISTPDELKEYFDLQDNLGLRHPKALSLNHYEAVRIFIPHKIEPYVLLLPYDRQAFPFSTRTHVNKGQSVHAMVSYGILKETGLRMVTMDFLGPAIEPELVAAGEPSRIYIVGITEYIKRMEYEPLYGNGHTNGPPVWVHIDLLSLIFEIVSNEEDRYQLETYRRGKQWLAHKK